jgi:hypothetical protein
VIEALAFVQPILLDPFQIDWPGMPNDLDLFLPNRRIEYPDLPGAYLRIEARESLAAATVPEARPMLVFVLRLPKAMTVSRIEMLGNLLTIPANDARGAKSNFGLPHQLSIFAVDAWPPDIVLVPPHPRDWRPVFSTRDFRALWG